MKLLPQFVHLSLKPACSFICLCLIPLCNCLFSLCICSLHCLCSGLVIRLFQFYFQQLSALFCRTNICMHLFNQFSGICVQSKTEGFTCDIISTSDISNILTDHCALIYSSSPFDTLHGTSGFRCVPRKL